jgi:hypothetical protein
MLHATFTANAAVPTRTASVLPRGTVMTKPAGGGIGTTVWGTIIPQLCVVT